MAERGRPKIRLDNLPEDWRDRQHLDHTSSDGTMSPPTRIEIAAPGDGAD